MTPSAQASPKSLEIHAVEVVIGKFHRYDQTQKPSDYSISGNVWRNIATLSGETTSGHQPQIVENLDGSLTIYFWNLQSLLETLVAESSRRHQVIQTLNIDAHGVPGGLWFPADENEMLSPESSAWLTSAMGSDKAVYDDYYSPISKEDLQSSRAMGDREEPNFKGVSGLTEWKKIAASVASENHFSDLRRIFADHAQIHLLACQVGLGLAGERFTEGIAQLLLPNDGFVVSAMNYGMGDGSMPHGMGLWDYQNDQELALDNIRYPKDNLDSEISQRGRIRISTARGSRIWSNVLYVAPENFLAKLYEQGAHLDFEYYAKQTGEKLEKSMRQAESRADRTILAQDLKKIRIHHSGGKYTTPRPDPGKEIPQAPAELPEKSSRFFQCIRRFLVGGSKLLSF